MSSHRKPPLSPERPGWCRWCDQPIEPYLKKDGTPRKVQPQMHRECSKEYWACCNPLSYLGELLRRDGAGCRECGWMKNNSDAQCEVDHRIPLWKVAHLPAKKRREYFKINNLRLLCGDCHSRKSAKEAAERAHVKRLAQGGKKKSGARVQSRGFDKRFRKRMNGTVEVRH